MDATMLAGALLEPVPANATMGLRVVHAVDGVGEVAADAPPAFANVIGALHSSGLIALADAAGLAAVISAAQDPDDLAGVQPLGAAAHLEFLAPARGPLVTRCELTDADRAELAVFYAERGARITLTTRTHTTDEDGTLVCRGEFTWSVKVTWPGLAG